MEDFILDDDEVSVKKKDKDRDSREQDRFLPIANVGRIMKKLIPTNGKISKEAKEMTQECVSEFISFVTGEASEKCQKEKRKTITGNDIIWSIANLGFVDYVNPLKLYLAKLKSMEDRERLNTPDSRRADPRPNPPPLPYCPYPGLPLPGTLFPLPMEHQRFCYPGPSLNYETNREEIDRRFIDHWLQFREHPPLDSDTNNSESSFCDPSTDKRIQQ